MISCIFHHRFHCAVQSNLVIFHVFILILLEKQSCDGVYLVIDGLLLALLMERALKSMEKFWDYMLNILLVECVVENENVKKEFCQTVA